MSKLSLKKKVVSVLTKEEQASIKGGAGTTSYSNCTGFLCCNPQGCERASEGYGNTCNLSPCASLAGGAPNCTGGGDGDKPTAPIPS